MPSRILRVRTVAVAGLALLSIGGVAAAAAGLAPASAERATQASPRTPDGQVGHAQGEAATLIHRPDGAAASKNSTPGKSSQSSDHAVGPDASGAAKQGLCQAWFAGQGDEHGKRMDATAFQALAAAAGGADQVAAYCEQDADTSTHGRRPADKPAKPAPPTTGPPESPGQGHGQGGPPTTG